LNLRQSVFLSVLAALHLTEAVIWTFARDAGLAVKSSNQGSFCYRRASRAKRAYNTVIHLAITITLVSIVMGTS
jgi:hypothetical protein